MDLELDLTTAVIRELVKQAELLAIPPKRWDIVDSTVIPYLSVKVSRPGAEAIWRSGVYDCDVELKLEYLATNPNTDASRLIGLCEQVLVEDLAAHEKLTDNNLHAFGVWRTGGRNATSGKHRQRILTVAVRCFEKASIVLEFADSETGLIFIDSETGLPLVDSS